MDWLGYKNYDHFFKMSDLTGLDRFIEEVEAGLEDVSQLMVTKQGVTYYNLPASFDIETTSTYTDNGEKFAFMYIWQLGVNGSVIVGRTWEEFDLALRTLRSKLDISLNKRMILYVHNLAFEFQFIRKRFKWLKDEDGNDCVFSLKSRKPIYALSRLGYEFRCSYIYSNYGLEYLGANLIRKYLVTKKSGNLDYRLVRHSETPLSDAEIEYCLDDVRVVMSYIQEEIEIYGDISQLTLTNTGKVRKYCRAYCFGEYEKTPELQKKAALEYHAIMKGLQIKSTKEYNQLKNAFAGGFTHAGALHAMNRCVNVGSADLTSSYPAVMCYQYFPMSSSRFIGTVKSMKRLLDLCNNYCCLFDVRFHGLYTDFEYESYISVSKCYNISDYVANNGRVVSAETLQITVTEVDFAIIKDVYAWEDMEVFNMRIYDRGYLPRPFIEAILGLYEKKTSLKGIEDKIIEYMVSKNMINASFGMAVTDIVRDDAIYTQKEWCSLEADGVSQLSDYNTSFNRFLFYPWGVWVTAHARYNLWQAIFEFGPDFVYADTDSIKGMNFNNHLHFFQLFNARIRNKLYNMCEYYNIPYTAVEPKTIKGEKKLIGVWDIEEGYKYFKTLGAKRYMYEHESGEFNLTVSGVNKKMAAPYLLVNYCGFPEDIAELAYTSDPRKKKESKEAMKKLLELHASGLSYKGAFDAFDQSLEIPPGKSGKLTHTYIDDARAAWVRDYKGNPKFVVELSSTHLEPAGYYFSISKQYYDFLLGNLITEE